MIYCNRANSALYERDKDTIIKSVMMRLETRLLLHKNRVNRDEFLFYGKAMADKGLLYHR